MIALRKARSLHIVEADRGKDGKLVSGMASAHAREHMLASSIAMNTGDHDEAVRRLDSARIYTSHSGHAKADEAGQLLEDAVTLLKNGNAEKANAKVDAAYGMLQGEPNKLLQMKKKRESAPMKHGALIETLTFNPRFLEGTYDPVKKTVDVLIFTEGIGNARDKHYYTKSCVELAVKDKIFESQQAYADHPSKFDDANRPERSVRDLIGYYYGSKLTEVTDPKTGLRVAAYGATFKIQQGLDWVDGIVRESIDFSKKFPGLSYTGISMNADGDTVPTERGGVEVNDVVRITESFSADMVTKPARGGGFLRLVEGAGGAHHPTERNNMQKLLTAASTLEKLAEGEEVDPKTLKDLAKSIREADADVVKESADKGNGKSGGVAGSGDELEKNGSSNNKVALDDLDEAFKPKPAADAVEPDADDAGDGKGDGKKTVTVTESNKNGNGNLREAEVIELKTKYPSLYAAALREASANVGNDVTKLRSENSQLRAENLIRESLSIGRHKLTESKLPEGAFDRMLQQMVGLTESEMDDVIVAETKYLESVGLIGAKRVGGNGERTTTMRESGDVATTTSLVLAGLTGDN